MEPIEVYLVEMEYSIGWIVENPALFKASYDKFFDDHDRKEWDITAYASRRDFLTLIAERKS